MRGGSGILFLASWRIGFSIFVWIGSVLFLFLLWQCLKSFLQAVKDQGTALFCDAETVQPPGGARSRERDSDVYTVNCPPTNPYCPDHSGRQVSSLTNLEYTLPNTPTPSVDPPPYNSVLHNTPEEPPPAYESLYTQKDNPRPDTLPPV